MECVRHGIRRPAFVCQHLRLGEGLGFNTPPQPVDPELPFHNAWCDDCDAVLAREGEWNDVSEAFAGVIVICEGCLEEIRSRNQSRKP
jgi:hypothetical protein